MAKEGTSGWVTVGTGNDSRFAVNSPLMEKRDDTDRVEAIWEPITALFNHDVGTDCRIDHDRCFWSEAAPIDLNDPTFPPSPFCCQTHHWICPLLAHSTLLIPALVTRAMTAAALGRAPSSRFLDASDALPVSDGKGTANKTRKINLISCEINDKARKNWMGRANKRA